MNKALGLAFFSTLIVYLGGMENIQPEAFLAIQRKMGFTPFIKQAPSPDGSKIAVLTTTGIFSVWDTRTAELIEESTVSNKENVESITFNAKGTKIIITTPEGSEEVTIVNPQAFKQIKKNTGKIIKKAQSADSSKIVTLNPLGIVSLWDGLSGDVIDPALATNKGDALSLKFNDEGTKVIIRTPRSTQEFDIVNPQALKVIQKKMEPLAISKKAQSPDGTTIAILDNKGSVSLWDISSEKAIKKAPLLSMGFNAQGNLEITPWSYQKKSTA